MDGRKKNGNKGHSTKAKGIDKRRNEYKEAVKQAVTFKDLKKVLKMLVDKAINQEDTGSAKILLEYTLGKPTEQKDITTNGKDIIPNLIISEELSNELNDKLEDEY